MTLLFMLGLVISGVTAIPLPWEVKVLSELSGTGSSACLEELSAPGRWLEFTRFALSETAERHPFLFYGTDWLAFGHIIISIVFIGALRDPVRNRWLFDFGLIACVLVIPWALIFGAVRGIPLWWRLIDCSFGVIGAVPLWFCRKWTRELVSRNGGQT